MISIKVFWDEEAQVWVAISEKIGLFLESESYDILLQRVRVAAPEMAAENGIPCFGIELNTLTQPDEFASDEEVDALSKRMNEKYSQAFQALAQ